jgi:serine phosphatase RsbU (regulator of sigma subunit)/anti-sigma regulatory factor (Ser/Thr protein kinase)
MIDPKQPEGAAAAVAPNPAAGETMTSSVEVKVESGVRPAQATAADVDRPAPSTPRHGLTGRLLRRRPDTAKAPAPQVTSGPDVEIAPNDPILGYFHESPGVVDIRTLALESPALERMREAGFVLVVPLVTSGELVGLLQLGPRLSERDYSKDDRQLLEQLARYAAPALRLGQMVRQQEVEARERERFEQELKVAQLIQQQFLPKTLPDLPTWQIAAFYRPARTVGGDFYDFIPLEDGRVMVVTGDVTDKGVPAALVMSSTHALLRETGPRLQSPSAVLARVNDLLCEDIPAHMFVTCLAMVLDPPTGRVEFANAGHNLPYVRGVDGTVRELHATGMPLGLMPGTVYDQCSAVIAPGEQLLLYSDGLTEQHDAHGEMFGFGRTADLVAQARDGEELTDLCVSKLALFTGPGVEQEDDITLVALRRTQGAAHAAVPADVLASFSLPSEPGNEREALARVAEAVAGCGLTEDQLERLKTAVAEAAMNAIEHGNGNQPEIPVDVVVHEQPGRVVVTVTDHGAALGSVGATHPDLELKLAGLQTPRGWGLFLIENMVDEVEQSMDDGRHTVRLVMNVGHDAPSQGGT